VNTLDPEQEWMQMALTEAEAARIAGDVPVGAIVVDPTGRIVGRGRNRREERADPTAHAEIEALREAASAAQSWRLSGHVLVVTLEPCVMCAGALVNARIGRLIYGCRDEKAGAVDSLFAIGRDPRLNHRFAIRGGVLAAACAAPLKTFFAARRGR
jgi:tRNA(adenine34) deaminase